MALIPLVFYAIIGAAVTLFLLLTPFVESSIGIPIVIALWGLIIFLFVLHIIAAILWYRHAAYAYNATLLTITQGAFDKVTTIIPRKKIQWAQTHQNPFQRFSKVATIAATTAAGVGGTRTALRDVQLEKADAFIDWVRPRPRR
jgi:putative membrane protein